MWECIDFTAQLNAELEFKQGMGLDAHKGANPGIWLLLSSSQQPRGCGAGIANVATKNKPPKHSG